MNTASDFQTRHNPQYQLRYQRQHQDRETWESCTYSSSACETNCVDNTAKEVRTTETGCNDRVLEATHDGREENDRQMF